MGWIGSFPAQLLSKQMVLDTRLLGGMVVLYKRAGMHRTSRKTTKQFWLQQIKYLNPAALETSIESSDLEEFILHPHPPVKLSDTAFRSLAYTTRSMQKQGVAPNLSPQKLKEVEAVVADCFDGYYVNESASKSFIAFLEHSNWRVPSTGHTGTLDPFAEGALTTVYGLATKMQDMIKTWPKRYSAIIKFGEQTFSGDHLSSVTARHPSPDSWKIPSQEELDKIIQEHLTGDISLPAPIMSAKKKNSLSYHKLGRKLKDDAEKEGKLNKTQEDFEEEFDELVGDRMTKMSIYSIKSEIIDSQRVKVDVVCGRGTYIRSVGVRLGELLGTFAHLEYLERKAENFYSVGDDPNSIVECDEGENFGSRSCSFHHYHVDSLLKTCTTPIVMEFKTNHLAHPEQFKETFHNLVGYLEATNIQVALQELSKRSDLKLSLGSKCIGVESAVQDSPERDALGNAEYEKEIHHLLRRGQNVNLDSQCSFKPYNDSSLKPDQYYTLYVAKPGYKLASNQVAEEQRDFGSLLPLLTLHRNKLEDDRIKVKVHWMRGYFISEAGIDEQKQAKAEKRKFYAEQQKLRKKEKRFAREDNNRLSQS